VTYYARDGSPLTLEQWAGSFQTRQDQKRVAETTLPNGRWVSTVWLGLDHSFGSGPPLIFETMVFPKEGEWGELDADRYSTEVDALAGHERMCAKLSVEHPDEDTVA
jgi:hypothetical protein